MIDEYITEQKVACQILKNAIKNNKVSHAYLFEMNGYNEKEAFAIATAKLLLCPNKYSNNNNCGKCTQCKNIEKNNFSELKIIKPDGLWIKKSQLDELQQEFNTMGIESNRRIYVIEQADRLNNQAANSILKFLEEPSENITAILLTDNIYQMLDTIVSRCQIITLARTNKYSKIEIIDQIKNNILIDVPEEKISEYVENVLNYVKYFETNGIDTILKNQKLWHNNLKEKNEIIFGFNLMILIYKDILNYKIKEKFEIFNEYKNDLELIILNNDISKINKKIKIIMETKDKINYNINNNLLMDKLIMQLERCDNND